MKATRATPPVVAPAENTDERVHYNVDKISSAPTAACVHLLLARIRALEAAAAPPAPPAFTPVVVTLETQEEVDALAAIVGSNRLSTALHHCQIVPGKWFAELAEFHGSERVEKNYEHLRNL